MAATSFVLVLTAALLHASWNALMKAGGDRLMTNWAIVSAAAILNVPVVLMVGPPQRSVWWILALTCVLHVIYNLFLVAAYERADLAVAYPIARGTAPMITLVAGIVLLGDSVEPVGAVGVVLITLGLGLAATGRPLRDTRWAMATGVIIAAYTLVDGYGVRRNGGAVQFISTSFIIYAVVLTAIVVRRRGVERMRDVARAQPVTLLIGGGANAAGYLLVMIAARTEPLGLVSGLREMSALFGLLLAGVVLHEHVSGRQIIAISIAVVGAAAIAA